MAQSVSLPAARPLLAGEVPERARRGELAELVADHGLGDVDGHVLAAVVDGDRVADHVGDDRGAPRPRLHDALLPRLVQPLDLDPQVVVDERALLETSRHCYLRAPRPRLRRMIIWSEALFLALVR